MLAMTPSSTKIKKHGAAFHLANGIFHPLAVSALGYWERTSLADIYRLCTVTGPRHGVSPDTAAHTLIANIACEIARGNHSILQLARSPSRLLN